MIFQSSKHLLVQTLTIDIRKMCEICSKLTINDVNDVVQLPLLLTLNIFHNFFSVSIVDFKQEKVWWEFVTVISLC